jgi:hypothetical protein
LLVFFFAVDKPSTKRSSRTGEHDMRSFLIPKGDMLVVAVGLDAMAMPPMLLGYVRLYPEIDHRHVELVESSEGATEFVNEDDAIAAAEKILPNHIDRLVDALQRKLLAELGSDVDELDGLKRAFAVPKMQLDGLTVYLLLNALRQIQVHWRSVQEVSKTTIVRALTGFVAEMSEQSEPGAVSQGEKLVDIVRRFGETVIDAEKYSRLSLDRQLIELIAVLSKPGIAYWFVEIAAAIVNNNSPEAARPRLREGLSHSVTGHPRRARESLIAFGRQMFPDSFNAA